MAEFETGIEWSLPPIHAVMGSDSDARTVAEAIDLIGKFGIPTEERVISAHRTHEQLSLYCDDIEVREEELVIMAFAGMSAALGGDLAARVPNFVVGVPLLNKADTMNASIGAQLFLPPGNGLAIVGPDQGVNAGLAALRALGTGHPELRHALTAYQKKNEDGVVAKDTQMRELGVKAYIAKQEKLEADRKLNAGK